VLKKMLFEKIEVLGLWVHARSVFKAAPHIFGD
jgi:hypothetical protein